MGTPAWHGENELITEVDLDFGEVRLLDGVKSSTPNNAVRRAARDRLRELGWATQDPARSGGASCSASHENRRPRPRAPAVQDGAVPDPPGGGGDLDAPMRSA